MRDTVIKTDEDLKEDLKNNKGNFGVIELTLEIPDGNYAGTIEGEKRVYSKTEH